jgi:nucleoside-diphosphate-sugar epimerase
VTIVRPGVVVGRGTPMQHSGLGLWVRDNHCVGWGRGENPLPFVWVEDVAGALVRLARHEGRGLDGKALNLCAAPPLCAREASAELARASGRRIEFHPRALALSQALEIGKWLVKKVGRRPGASFPSWHDLACRALRAPLPSRGARELLGWRPLEERGAFVERALRPMARPADGPAGG